MQEYEEVPRNTNHYYHYCSSSLWWNGSTVAGNTCQQNYAAPCSLRGDHSHWAMDKMGEEESLGNTLGCFVKSPTSGGQSRTCRTSSRGLEERERKRKNWGGARDRERAKEGDWEMTGLTEGLCLPSGMGLQKYRRLTVNLTLPACRSLWTSILETWRWALGWELRLIQRPCFSTGLFKLHKKWRQYERHPWDVWQYLARIGSTLAILTQFQGQKIKCFVKFGYVKMEIHGFCASEIKHQANSMQRQNISTPISYAAYQNYYYAWLNFGIFNLPQIIQTPQSLFYDFWGDNPIKSH